MTDLVESSATDITFDNIHLSKPIPASQEPTSAVLGDRRLPFNCTDPKILEFLVAATAPNTRRAYEGDVRHFLAGGGRIPATTEQVARYLADHAASLVWRHLRVVSLAFERRMSSEDFLIRPKANSFV